MTEQRLDRKAADNMLAERAATYAVLYPGLREVARQHGYALALHGTLQKDLDLLAVPWIDEASTSDDLAEALRAHLGGDFVLTSREAPAWSQKPHGRKAWTIMLRGAGYIDLSVMPTR